jgi:hypothetical protein
MAGAVFLADGQHLFCATSDGVVRQWEVPPH